ncbi:putative inactive poly ADP-ribose polymerase [Nymphaea thermarum]|nr:putative inactive poly ADP-ribose polymerase [Nymphaea thermarum]
MPQRLFKFERCYCRNFLVLLVLEVGPIKKRRCDANVLSLWAVAPSRSRQGKMASTRRNRAMAIEKRIRAATSSRNLNLGSPGHGISRCEGNVGEFGCCYRRALMRNHENFRKSRAPSRFMFYKDCQWNDYPDETISVLKDGFVNGRAAVYLETDGGYSIVDFLRMLEVDLGQGSHRSVAWIDVEGHCFFPELFSEEGSGESCGSDPNMEIQLRVRREDGALDAAESDAVMPTPREELESAPYDSRVQGGVSPDLVPQNVPSLKGLLLRLKETDRAHNIVKNVFLRGMRNSSSKACVTAVYRCSTGARLQDFKRMAERTEAARGHANVRYAWYETTAKDVGKIVMHGFGKSNLCSGPGSFGIGINLFPASCSYLSASAAETDINGDHHIILCRVIMGNVEEVQFGSEQACPSCDEFDNGVDDALNTKRYIMWSTNMNSHILPECVLTFRDYLHPKGTYSPNFV